MLVVVVLIVIILVLVVVVCTSTNMFNFQNLFWSVQLTNSASQYWNSNASTTWPDSIYHNNYWTYHESWIPYIKLLFNMATIHWFNLMHPLIILDMMVAILQSPHCSLAPWYLAMCQLSCPKLMHGQLVEIQRGLGTLHQRCENIWTRQLPAEWDLHQGGHQRKPPTNYCLLCVCVNNNVSSQL